MPGEPENQFSLVRGALSTDVRAKGNLLSFIFCFHIFIVFALVHASSVHAAEVQYRVTGHLTHHAIRRDAAQKGEFVSYMACSVYSFVVDVKGCRWSVRIAPEKLYVPEDVDFPGKGDTNWNILAVSDGNEFCEVMGGPRKVPNGVFSAKRGPGAAPFCVDENMAMVWYAYASHCVLRDTSSNLIVPMEGGLNGRSKIVHVPGRWELRNSVPALPNIVDTFGYMLTPDERKVLILPPEEARKNVMLKVISTTNLHNVTLPMETVVNRYLVTRWNGPVESRPFGQVVLQTTSVELNANVSEYPPPLVGRYVVSDYRGLGLSNLVVVNVVTDKGWASEMLVKSQAQSTFRRTSQAERVSWPMRGLFVLLLVLSGLGLRRLFVKKVAPSPG